MRVAVVTENFLPKLDGVTRTLAMLLEHLRRRGHQAILIGPEGSPRRYAGFRVFGARGLPLPFYPELRALAPPLEFGQRLSRFRPDVLHVADPMLLGAAGIAWARRVGAPIVSSYHTNLAAYCAHYGFPFLQEPAWFYRKLLHNQCETTLCPSPSTAREVERHGFERVSVWPRGVDSALFNPSQRSEEWRRAFGDKAKKIVLYVGRLSYEKNLQVLADAFKALDEPGVALVLVGDGPARESLEQSLAGNAVAFTGYLTGEALAMAYASADVFAFPSLTETFGQVVQEAMASGLPVVGFDAEGVRDLVTDGETGLLAGDQSALAFAEALRRALHSDQLRATLGARAHAFAATRNWEGVMDRLLAMYEEAITGYDSDAAA
ncbi:MAG TPA: glycosyltransferase family 1 protein [Ktedonobacterales bacterium]|jgi:glycosyltransferase involved in cell wall biosynthesis|nr:glycosyltransferase family 1 protein [Ktedonobacterales bacterium]